MKRRTIWLSVAVVAALAIGAAAIGAVVLAIKLSGGTTSVGGEKRYLDVRLEGEIPEEPASDFDALFGATRASLPGIVEGLESASSDDKITAVVVKIGDLTGTGWGKTQEIRAALTRLREKKTVLAYLEDAGSKEYYLASAASKVYCAPTAMLAVTGLATQVTFYRHTLDKLGIEAQFEGFGKYKNAPNRYTEPGFTPAHREQMDALLDDLYAQFVDGIAKGRGRDPQQIRDAVDQAPLSSATAVALGLVDERIYEDELPSRAGATQAVPLARYVRSQRSMGLGRPKIALIQVSGEIITGRSGGDAFGGTYAGSETVTKAIRTARQRSDVRAIVLRIDSPGGGGSASDAIWREVVLAQREKPVIASMGDMAASGGYYVAMAAQGIVANPGTLTGSIGVFGGKMSLRGLYDKIGLSKEELQRGQNAGLFSDYRTWTEEERLKIRGLLGVFYQQFVQKAAEGRGRKPEEIERVAQGRVWTGASALGNGLVDQLGGLREAINLAKEKAGVSQAAEVTIVHLPERRGFLEAFFDRETPAILVGAVPADARSLLRWARMTQSGPILARIPFEVQID
jgi:protease IV